MPHQVRSLMPFGTGRAGLITACFVLGIALSGFFDGILLHQILQWHHLLSLVDAASLRDLRAQILADGLFHLFAYLLAGSGCLLLWKVRREVAKAGSGRLVIGSTLLGFGAWNIFDVGVFHWIAGIHRVRLDVANPLLYDLLWFFGLGIAICAVGLWFLRRPKDRSGRHGRAAAVTVFALIITAISNASLPAVNGNSVIILRSDGSLAEVINAAQQAEGRLILVDPASGLLVVNLPGSQSYPSLYRAGALYVTRSPALTGCLAFTRIS